MYFPFYTAKASGKFCEGRCSIDHWVYYLTTLCEGNKCLIVIIKIIIIKTITLKTYKLTKLVYDG